MTKQEILKGNRLIGEYMGRSFSMSHISDYKNCPDDELPKMKYHTSWDWLMPVVEKISKVPLLNPDDTQCTDPQDVCFPLTFGMPTEDGKRVMVRINAHIVHEAPTLKEAAYKAVIDFIHFENERNNEKNNS